MGVLSAVALATEHTHLDGLSSTNARPGMLFYAFTGCILWF